MEDLYIIGFKVPQQLCGASLSTPKPKLYSACLCDQTQWGTQQVAAGLNHSWACCSFYTARATATEIQHSSDLQPLLEMVALAGCRIAGPVLNIYPPQHILPWSICSMKWSCSFPASVPNLQVYIQLLQQRKGLKIFSLEKLEKMMGLISDSVLVWLISARSKNPLCSSEMCFRSQVVDKSPFNGATFGRKSPFTSIVVVCIQENDLVEVTF